MEILLQIGPWDEKTGVFAPLFQQPYQVDAESLRNVVRTISRTSTSVLR